MADANGASGIPGQGFPYQASKEDPVKFLQSQEQMARELEIKVQTVKLMQEEIKFCYRKNGVNHYQACKEVTSKYMAYIRDPYFNWIKPAPSDE
mmetsp:Transcript_69946/g.195644  ORF Transcript_69946/g.195644 Transcript_69946/m.195644 type:complete len:94 (+) Transcript_69946:67-348(+)|eukprot:CAMPEP_0119471896 /NCGR_PEP_ID=MMETSP1344-20130328/4177_1 /TAXON_ID=236787 /ORGANISM="Florenciella parvula, Strain CCMP2471" /LENGTH=93 /DNA_ID=CAMNT_0007504747 /DNA_START=97 /DNA_END=378 /DNA_ORIENTATION=-